MLGKILEMVKFALGLQADFQAARRDRRDRISDYFKAIAETLNEVHLALKKGKYPAGKCSEMAVHIEYLVKTIEGEIDFSKANELANLLRDGQKVEELYYEAKNSPEADKNLNALAWAAGQFSGLAAAIRAGA